jgi:hypothetical protein
MQQTIPWIWVLMIYCFRSSQSICKGIESSAQRNGDLISFKDPFGDSARLQRCMSQSFARCGGRCWRRGRLGSSLASQSLGLWLLRESFRYTATKALEKEISWSVDVMQSSTVTLGWERRNNDNAPLTWSMGTFQEVIKRQINDLVKEIHNLNGESPFCTKHGSIATWRYYRRWIRNINHAQSIKTSDHLSQTSQHASP